MTLFTQSKMKKVKMRTKIETKKKSAIGKLACKSVFSLRVRKIHSNSSTWTTQMIINSTNQNSTAHYIELNV